jgi:hypothetical protein
MAALVMLVVLLVAAVVSAATWLRYAEDISDINPFFAEVAAGVRIIAVLYCALAGIALLGVVVLVVGRPRLGTRLLLAILTLTVPGQSLILYGEVFDNADVLDEGPSMIGEPTVAMVALQLAAVATTALATVAALMALTRRR